MKCPLCGIKVEYMMANGTHTWSCPDCPFVAMEFYGDNDWYNLGKKLKVKEVINDTK